MSDHSNNQGSEANKGFSLPEGYFGRSAAQLLERLACVEELKGYPTLQKIDKKNAFEIPQAYFEKSAQGLELLPYQKLSKVNKTNNFICPDNFFAQQANELEAVVINNQLAHIAKQQNFEVPANYFEQKSAQLSQLAGGDKKTRIISLNFYKFGMAAAAILLITLGLWYSKSDEKIENNDDCGTLACIERRELLKSKQIENLDDDDLIELVNPEQLQKKLIEPHNNKIKGDEHDSSINLIDVEDLPEDI